MISVILHFRVRQHQAIVDVRIAHDVARGAVQDAVRDAAHNSTAEQCAVVAVDPERMPSRSCCDAAVAAVAVDVDVVVAVVAGMSRCNYAAHTWPLPLDLEDGVVVAESCWPCYTGGDLFG